MSSMPFVCSTATLTLLALASSRARLYNNEKQKPLIRKKTIDISDLLIENGLWSSDSRHLTSRHFERAATPKFGVENCLHARIENHYYFFAHSVAVVT
jgi:hypothetical protein